jgi:predicted phage terminase large subunit-like protein
MTDPVRAFLAAATRQDFTTFIHRTFQTVSPGIPFQPSWHVELLADRLEACRTGRIKRLLICLPPRHLKSLCASIAFPAWMLGHDPSRRIICASYSIELAGKLAGDCRAVMESSWYRAAFPDLRLASATELELATTARGFRLTTSIGGTLTGRGGDVIVIDDPLKAGDALSEPRRTAVNDWFRNTLYSRLDNKAAGVIIVVTQRLHVDDLVGYLLSTGEHWDLLQLPAIAITEERYELAEGTVLSRRAGAALHPEREPLAVLEAIRRTLGSYEFAAQYQQEPVPLEGGLIKAAWLRRYAAAPERQSGDLVTQSWDTASKSGELNDYSVCATWLRRGQEHYLLDVFRARLDYPELRRAVVRLKQAFAPDVVLIEDKGSGIQLIQDLRAEGRVRPIAIAPEGDKVTRMYTQTHKLEAGRVLLPERAPWLDEFVGEVLAFPHGWHDDQVDAMSQYLFWEPSRRRVPGEFIIARSKWQEECDRLLGPRMPYSDWL